MKAARFWLMLTGLVVLLHIILIILSILEVAVYSYLIEPGHDEAYYQEHAQVSAPWVSGIFGFVLTFLFVKLFIDRNRHRHLLFAIGLPLVYVALDVLILLPFGIDWNAHLPVLLMANGAKLAGALLAFYLYSGREERSDLTSPA